MFAGLLAATFSNADEHVSDMRASPLSPISFCGTSASFSTRRKISEHRNGQPTCSNEDFYRLSSHCSPLVGTAYSSPQTDGRPRRSRSSQYLSPFSATDGDVSPAAAVTSGSSDPPEGPSYSLGRVSVSPPHKACDVSTVNRPDRDMLPSSPSFPLQSRNDKVPSSLSGTPTPVVDGLDQNVPSSVASTPPCAASTLLDKSGASPAVARVKSTADAENVVLTRSGTRQCRSKISQPSLLSPLSARVSMPGEPLLEDPPVPAKEPSVGEAIAAGKCALTHHSPPSPLRFSVCYTEEEHRVRLETHEMEERRCLYQAHKALLSVYRMWAAEGSNRGFSDDDKILPMSPRWRDFQSTRYIDCFPPDASNTVRRRAADSRAPPSPSAADDAVAADRVRSFLNSSISSARDRRGGGAHQEGVGAGSESAQQAKMASLACVDCEAGTHRSSPGRPNRLRASHMSSPPASRILDYSSMQMADAASPLRCTFGGPLSVPNRTRLFSPWHTPRTDKYSDVTRCPGGAACAESEGGKNRDDRHGRPQKVSRASLVPHLARTPRTADRLSFASAPPRSLSATRRQRGLPDSRDTALSMAGVTPFERVSASLRTLSPPVPGGCSNQPLSQNKKNGAFQWESRPVWNSTVGLGSALAASEHMSSAAGDHPTGNRVGSDPTRYPSDRDARLRQLSVLPVTHGNDNLWSPRKHTASYPNTSEVKQDLADRLSWRLSGASQHKRFFDAAYGEKGAFLSSERDFDVQQSAAGPMSPPLKRSSHAFPSSSSSGIRPDSNTGSWLRRSLVSSSPYRRLQSPEAVAGRDVFVPFPYDSTSRVRATPLRPEVTTRSSAGLSDRVLSLQGGDTALWGLSTETALFAARQTRLSTLEKLCRAELQRRWIEDQSVLLHRFILEGTAVLQRGRRSIVSSNSIPWLNSHSTTESRQRASQWVFIPNEVDQL